MISCLNWGELCLCAVGVQLSVCVGYWMRRQTVEGWDPVNLHAYPITGWASDCVLQGKPPSDEHLLKLCTDVLRSKYICFYINHRQNILFEFVVSNVKLILNICIDLLTLNTEWNWGYERIFNSNSMTPLAPSGCALQTNSQHCSGPWPPQLGVNPARAKRDPGASQEHQDPKAPWELQATQAGVALPVTQDLLDFMVLEASKVIWTIMFEYDKGFINTLGQFMLSVDNAFLKMGSNTLPETVTKITVYPEEKTRTTQVSEHERRQNLLLLLSAIKIKTESTNKVDVLMFTVAHETRSLNKWTSVKASRAKDNKYWMHPNKPPLIYHHFKTGEWLISRERCQTVPLYPCVLFQLVRSGEEQL